MDIQGAMKLNGKPAGLVDGPYGAWFLESYRSTHISLSSRPKMDVSSLNTMIEAFNSASHYSYSLGYGLTGLIWAIRCVKRKSENFDHILDQNVIFPILEEESIRLINARNYDLFNGANGIIMYLMRSDKLSEKVYKSYIQSLKENLKEGELIPPTSSLVKNNKKLRGINLGIPHGVAGCVLMLTRLFEYESNLECQVLLKESITYLLGKSRKNAEESGYFTYSDHPDSEIAPLAWCYGDLSAGYAIMKAGKTLQNDQFIGIGTSILDRTMDRGDFATEDLTMCHGGPCIAYIYHKAWKLTSSKRYLDRRKYWLEITKSLLDKYHQVECRNSTKQKEYLENNSIIYGYPGAYLALQTMQGNISSKWDSWMLL